MEGKELYSIKTKDLSLNISNTEIESVRNRSIEKTGLRIYKDGYIGVSGSIGKYNEADLEKKAIDNLKLCIPYNNDITADSSEKLILDDEIIDSNKFVDSIAEILSCLKNEEREFSFFNKARLVEKEVSLRNDNNLELLYKCRYVSLSLIIKEKNSPNIMDASFGYEGWDFDKQKIIDEIKEICRSYKTPVDLSENKRSLVVFTTGDYLPFLKFITELDGRKYGTNSSFFSGKIGQKLFSDNFSFYYSRNKADVFSPFFDAEGVVNADHRFPLIENGILKAPYTDKKISTQYNLPHTGSASSEHDSVPMPGFIGSYIKESGKDIVDLLSGERAIFVVISSGGDFTPGGDFGAPVQFGLLFDGKNFIGKLPTLQISSNIYDMFGNSYRGVSRDRAFELSNDKYIVMEMKVSKI